MRNPRVLIFAITVVLVTLGAGSAEGQLTTQSWCMPTFVAGSSDFCFNLTDSYVERVTYDFEGPDGGLLTQSYWQWGLSGYFTGVFVDADEYQFSFGHNTLYTSSTRQSDLGAAFTTELVTRNSNGDAPPGDPTNFRDISVGAYRFDGDVLRGAEGWSCFRENDGTQAEESACVAKAVPEPSTYLLMLTGVLGLGFVAWRRREKLA